MIKSLVSNSYIYSKTILKLIPIYDDEYLQKSIHNFVKFKYLTINMQMCILLRSLEVYL